jgi:hypothetical protein
LRRRAAALLLVLLLVFCVALSSATAEGPGCPNEATRVGPGALLPDCRAYEQVSPPNKFANDAGAIGGSRGYAWASADGDRILYRSRGPMGTVHRGLQNYTVGRRAAGGWSSESAAPGG